MLFCPMTFQDPATPIMEGMINFHNLTMFYLILVGTLVLWMLYRSFDHYKGQVLATNFSYPCTFEMDFSKPKLHLGTRGPWSHSTNLEIIWTLFPVLILILIGLPSFALLYSLEEILDPSLSIKAIGHQWYWSYECSDYNQKGDQESLQFDSYMKADNDLQKGEFRLLEVDNRLVLPTNTHLRLLVTSADVLHSWAVPSLGVKVDACPGRLNQVCIYLKRPGVFYGQCSEICGKSHGFMPIVIKAVDLAAYAEYALPPAGPVISSSVREECEQFPWTREMLDIIQDMRSRSLKP